ncbi:peptidoglycan DD-metalloendopeptidase family protein [candidate division WWE3 bacterium]|nr:peptidoglycan DD-metalloendopeptidase family protein [candidate division WWE3 bacterium]
MPFYRKNASLRDSSNSPNYFQLRFEGFSPEGTNQFNKMLNALKLFTKACGTYIVAKMHQLIKAFFSLFTGSIRLVNLSKEFLTAKLIWSRGRLGRPIATFFVMSAAFIVFTFGEVFNSTRFVSSQELNPDYLASTTDIIPRKNTALTTVPDSRKRAESFAYTVQGGDTLSSIGNRFKISVDALKYVNNLTDNSILSVGDEITIPPVSGLIHTVESGDTLSSIAQKYDVPPQAVADFNYILDTSSLALGTELVIPGASVPTPVVPVTPSIPGTVPGTTTPTPAPTPSSTYCVWPTSVRIITQYFTWYHNGIDIASPAGTAMPPLFACTGGVVTRSGWDPWGLGLHIRIDHGNGYETVYGHMSRLDVGYGESVSRGQMIGLLGNTGRSTGPHVHFMVKYGGVAQNPLNYMR